MPLLLLALSVLLAAPALSEDTFVPPIPIPAESTEWVSVRTPRFNVVSSAGEKDARRIARTLETLADALGAVHPRLRAGRIETRVFLFARRRESQAYFDMLMNRQAARTPGLFVSHEDGSGTMILDAASTWSNRTIIHELVHNVLASSGARLPLWLEEGIAEYFSTASISGDRLEIGRPIRPHALAVRYFRGMSLSEVFAAGHDSKLANASLLYAHSWAIVDWMMRAGEPRFYRFVADVESGVDADRALQRNFGISVRILEQSLRRAPLRPAARRTVRVEEHATDIAVEPMSRADALTSLGAFLGMMEIGRADAERHLLAAGDYPRATAERAFIRASEKKFDDAYRLFEEALAWTSDDLVIRQQYAEALLQNSFGPFAGVTEIVDADKARFRKARALLAGHDCGWRCDAILGSTYLAESDIAPGIPLLERALAARPTRTDAALNLYALLLRSGNQARAGDVFDRYFKNARNPQSTFAARAVFVREQLTLVNRLIAAQRVDEASQLLVEVIDLTPDPAAKRELEAQLLKLQDIAAVNREILAFNRAVDAANRGENDAAAQMLDTLIQSARDEKVIRDAKALREIVRKRPGMRRSQRAL